MRCSDECLVRLRSRSLARPYIGIKGADLKRAREDARISGEIRAAGKSQEKKKRLGFRRYRVFLAELVDPTTGIHNFLLAGIEGMTIRADFNLQILANGRTRLELVAAGTGDCDGLIFWMDAGFHRNLEF
jgi:hypothetical protein